MISPEPQKPYSEFPASPAKGRPVWPTLVLVGLLTAVAVGWTTAKLAPRLMPLALLAPLLTVSVVLLVAEQRGRDNRRLAYNLLRRELRDRQAFDGHAPGADRPGKSRAGKPPLTAEEVHKLLGRGPDETIEAAEVLAGENGFAEIYIFPTMFARFALKATYRRTAAVPGESILLRVESLPPATPAAISPSANLPQRSSVEQSPDRVTAARPSLRGKRVLKFSVGVLIGLVLGSVVTFGLGWFGLEPKGRGGGQAGRETIVESWRREHDETMLRSGKLHRTPRSPKSFAEMMKEEGWDPSLDVPAWRDKDRSRL